MRLLERRILLRATPSSRLVGFPWGMRLVDSFEQAVSRTRARYATSPKGDRYYVATKLKFDPIGRALHELTGALGEVFDVGCGRGQLGLLLYELGRLRTLSGIDWDERKVSVAQKASMGVGRYAKGDVRTAQIPESDTVIIADVLHYIAFDEQDAVLARAAAALRAKGSLIVRDVDARRTMGSVLARTCERLGVRFDVNRGQRLAFRPRADLCTAIEHVGLVVRDVVATPGLWLDNVLVVAERR